MRKLLLSAIMVVFALSIYGQCSDLFISEYVEGSHNNKAVEIYNPTAAAIDLSAYRIVRYSNGGTSPQALPLAGSLGSADVLVLVLDKQDPAGTGTDTIVFDALRLLADTFISGTYPGPMYFNGNDAVSLEKLNGTLVDLIGVIGQDPGQAWTADSAAGFTDALGGRWWTKNHTMVRKPTVQQGITNNPSYFNSAAEWDTVGGYNYFDGLGWHVCSCTPNSINHAVKVNNAYFFPNPVNGASFTVKGTEIIFSIEISNTIGQEIFKQVNQNQRGDMVISTGALTKGVYFVKINFADNTSTTKKIIIE